LDGDRGAIRNRPDVTADPQHVQERCDGDQDAASDLDRGHVASPDGFIRSDATDAEHPSGDLNRGGQFALQF
jgi:hypothetical protein